MTGAAGPTSPTPRRRPLPGPRPQTQPGGPNGPDGPHPAADAPRGIGPNAHHAPVYREPAHSALRSAEAHRSPERSHDRGNGYPDQARRGGTVLDAQPADGADSAVVIAARVGRLLGRTGWRIARQLPGAKTLERTVERETQRLQSYALGELRKVLEIPGTVRDTVRDNLSGAFGGGGNDQRAVALIDNTDPGASPLRAAMTELLERSTDPGGVSSNDYLFGTIVSQLIPDEARLLAALARDGRFAALDVVARRRGRGGPRVLFANASTVGRAAGLTDLSTVPTYLARLHAFGLVEFGPAEDALASEYDLLRADPAVRAALGATTRPGTPRAVEKTVRLATLGEQFWAACAPLPPQPSRQSQPPVAPLPPPAPDPRAEFYDDPCDDRYDNPYDDVHRAAWADSSARRGPDWNTF